MNADLLALLDQQIAELAGRLDKLRQAREVLGEVETVVTTSARARRSTAAKKAPRPTPATRNGHKVPTCGACGKAGHNRRSCGAAEDD